MLYILLFILVVILVILLSINITLLSKNIQIFGGKIFDQNWANEQGWNYYWWDWYYMDGQLYDLPRLQYMYKIFIDDTIIFSDEQKNNSIEWFRKTGYPEGIDKTNEFVLISNPRPGYIETMTILDNMLLFSIPYYNYTAMASAIGDDDKELNFKKKNAIKYRKQMQNFLISLGASIDNIPDCMFCNSFDNDIYTGSHMNTASCINTKESSSQHIIYAIIPEIIKSIGRGAFYMCDLREISIPKGVLIIQENAFSSNFNLNQLIFEERLPSDGKLIIENNAFRGCLLSSLITIPSFVIAIRYNAFKMSNRTMKDTRAQTYKNKKKCTVQIKIDMDRDGPLYIDLKTFDDCIMLDEIYDHLAIITPKNIQQLPPLPKLLKPPSLSSPYELDKTVSMEERNSSSDNSCIAPHIAKPRANILGINQLAPIITH